MVMGCCADGDEGVQRGRQAGAAPSRAHTDTAAAALARAPTYQLFGLGRA